jgi:galactokinase
MVRSLTANGERMVSLSDPVRAAADWTDYPLGVVATLRDAGIQIPALSIVIDGDIPPGAGLASSAALTVGVALSILAHASITLDDAAVAKVCQAAECRLAGVRCGLMDPLAVLCGQRGKALAIDCHTLDVVPTPLPIELQLVACNSMVRHAHAHGGFNRRREECEQALAFLQQADPTVGSLRDVTWRMLDGAGAAMPGHLRRRVEHVLAENERVHQFRALLAQGPIANLRECMAASHRSLRDLYEVSTRELDLLVDLAMALPGVVGARLMGGGFGGSTVNLVAREAVGGFCSAISDQYARIIGVTPEFVVGDAADGARVWDHPW